MGGRVVQGVLTEIDIPERGSVTVDGGTFESLAEVPSFWNLLEAGIISAEKAGFDHFKLRGSRYVGRALIGSVSLNLVEKVPGSLAALISSASSGAFRVTETDASASSLGELFALLARVFLDRTRLYVSQGLSGVYERREEAGSLIGGTLDTPGTVRLRAKGFRHMAAFSRPVFHRDLPKNRVILAALRQVELLCSQVALSSTDVAAARSLAHFFGDAHDLEVLRGPREGWVQEARRLEAESSAPAERDLLALAGVLLSHLSFELQNQLAERAPRSWFLNLENLFEMAVRHMLETVSPQAVSVVGGNTMNKSIFDAVSGHFRADPDLVLTRAETPFAVGDAKYKPWAGLSTASIHHDMYQLLAHASAFGAVKAFLVFAHDEFDSVHLGKSATGTDTWAFAVDVRNLEAGLRRLLATMA